MNDKLQAFNSIGKALTCLQIAHGLGRHRDTISSGDYIKYTRYDYFDWAQVSSPCKCSTPDTDLLCSSSSPSLSAKYPFACSFCGCPNSRRFEKSYRVSYSSSSSLMCPCFYCPYCKVTRSTSTGIRMSQGPAFPQNPWGTSSSRKGVWNYRCFTWLKWIIDIDGNLNPCRLRLRHISYCTAEEDQNRF